MSLSTWLCGYKCLDAKQTREKKNIKRKKITKKKVIAAIRGEMIDGTRKINDANQSRYVVGPSWSSTERITTMQCSANALVQVQMQCFTKKKRKDF